MTALDRRRAAQRLLGNPCDDAAAVVHWFGAMQAQDLPASMWAVALRTAGTTGAAITAAIDDGVILRTHVLRPTWHLVHRDDARWLLQLTSPRIRQGIAGRLRQLNLDAATVNRGLDVIAAHLADAGSATRQQLATVLAAAGIAPDGQRMPHLLLCAELQMRIITGPLRNGIATYAPFDGRAPESPLGDVEEQLATLCIRYFRSHGPAQLPDLAWWSGLPLRDVQRGVAAAGEALCTMEIDGMTYWVAADAEGPARHTDDVHLLPTFDEYTVGYRDRSLLVDARHAGRVATLRLGLLSNVVLHDGRVAGTWRLHRGAASRLQVEWFGAQPATSGPALDAAVRRLSEFAGSDVTLV